MHRNDKKQHYTVHSTRVVIEKSENEKNKNEIHETPEILVYRWLNGMHGCQICVK